MQAVDYKFGTGIENVAHLLGKLNYAVPKYMGASPPTTNQTIMLHATDGMLIDGLCLPSKTLQTTRSPKTANLHPKSLNPEPLKSFTLNPQTLSLKARVLPVLSGLHCKELRIMDLWTDATPRK